MKTGFEKYADELNTNQNTNPKNVLKKKELKAEHSKTNKVIKPKTNLNQIYEMRSNNSSDYSTETLEKLE